MEADRILQILSKLNPRVLDCQYTDPFPFVSQTDIAHALGKIPEGPALYGRVAFARQEEFKPQLAHKLTFQFIESNTDYRTPKSYIGQDPIRKLAYMAITEKSGTTICPTCNSKGDVRIADTVYQCTTCQGFGYISPKQSRSWKFNVSPDAWDRFWEPIYSRDVLPILDRWETALVGGLNHCFPHIALYIKNVDMV